MVLRTVGPCSGEPTFQHAQLVNLLDVELFPSMRRTSATRTTDLKAEQTRQHGECRSREVRRFGMVRFGRRTRSAACPESHARDRDSSSRPTIRYRLVYR